MIETICGTGIKFYQHQYQYQSIYNIMYLHGKVHEYALLNYTVVEKSFRTPVRFDSIPIIIIELFCLFSKCVKVREAPK